MNTHLEQELSNITRKMFVMADLSIEGINSSISALKESNLDLARNIIDKDNLLDDLEKEIDEDCIRILVTKQPAAQDLRLVLTILKTNTDLERIGDLAGNIAKEVIRSEGKVPVKPLVDIPRMAEQGINMLKKAFKAITEKESCYANEAIEMDDFIDQLNVQVHRELFTFMIEHPTDISSALSLITVSRALERIGDHAKNIAERAIYYIEGEDIRHLKK